MYGNSGGSIPSEWAAELQSSYAPELNFSGVAFGGVAVNVSEGIHAHDGGQQAGTAVMVMLGLAAKYSDFNETLRAQLKTCGKHNATGFLAGYHYSVMEALGAYRNQSVWCILQDWPGVAT